MKLSANVQQAAAYTPVRTIVSDVLQELKGSDDALRTLLLQSAVLREFDAEALSRLARRPDEGPKLLEAVTLYLPAEQIGDNIFRYDEFTRQVLLDVAAHENEQLLVEAARIAADCYQEKAATARDAAQRQ